MRTARTLLFAHLGLALGCKNAGTPAAPDAPEIATVTPPPTVSAVPSETASQVTPVASVVPSASASTKIPTTIPIEVTATLPPGKCRSAADCPGTHARCDRSGAAATELGTCINVQIMRGRPLVVDGETHVASIDCSGDLEDAAREEHASIAAFARTICELMAFGAPSWLIRETQEALADEIRHTEMTLDAIERTTGKRAHIGSLPAATAPLSRDPAELFRDVFRGGAIGETRAAERAERERDAATDPEMRAFYDAIMQDEAKHAALAFRTLGWLLSAKPELGRVRDEEVARAPIDPVFQVLY